MIYSWFYIESSSPAHKLINRPGHKCIKDSEYFQGDQIIRFIQSISSKQSISKINAVIFLQTIANILTVYVRTLRFKICENNRQISGEMRSNDRRAVGFISCYTV